MVNTSKLIRQIPWSEARTVEPEVLLTHAWLATNGLGGYAAGTVFGWIRRMGYARGKRATN